MRKLICLCLTLLAFYLPLDASAQELPSPGMMASFSGELPEALRPAFADPKWVDWIVETGQWQSNPDGTAFYARLVMRNGEQRALCALLLYEGEITCFASGEKALYPGQIPELETVDNADAFNVVYRHADGTAERFRWFLGGDDNWRAESYSVMQGEQLLQQIRIAPRELYFDEDSVVFNTQSLMLQDFDAAVFPKNLEQAQALAEQSPLASADTALTRQFFDGEETTVPLHEHAEETAPVLMYYYSGVEVEVLEDGDAWARIRIGNLEGCMRREYLAFGADKAQVYPWDGDPGSISVPFPDTSLTLREHPAVDADSLGEVELFQRVRVLGYTPDLQWVQVRDTRDSAYLHPPQGPIGFMPAAHVPKTDNMRSAYIRNPDPRDRLNLRTEPRKDAESLGRYYNGLEVIFLHGSANSDSWRRVVIDGVVGYVDATYLDFSSDARPLQLPPLATVKTSGGGAALYADAALSGSPPDAYPDGSVVEVLGVAGKLGHVRTQDGKSGYMRLDDIGGEPASAVPGQFTLQGEISLYSDPSEDAEIRDILPSGETVQLYDYGRDHWQRAYDYTTDTFGPLEMVDRDWVFVLGEDSGSAGYARWSQIHP